MKSLSQRICVFFLATTFVSCTGVKPLDNGNGNIVSRNQNRNSPTVIDVRPPNANNQNATNANVNSYGSGQTAQSPFVGQTVSVEDFTQTVINSPEPVAVYFSADWCEPCKRFVPTLESLASKYTGRIKFVSVDVDKNDETALKYGIKGIPTLIIFKSGSEAERLVGAASEDSLSLMINRTL
jgi:thioredoxin 1